MAIGLSLKQVRIRLDAIEEELEVARRVQILVRVALKEGTFYPGGSDCLFRAEDRIGRVIANLEHRRSALEDLLVITETWMNDMHAAFDEVYRALESID